VKELRESWVGWHAIAPPLRKPFERYVDWPTRALASCGFADTGAMWRAKYDMPPDAFAKEVDKLWDQMRRSIFRCTLMSEASCARSTAPASCRRMARSRGLAGNMWAQEWQNIYPLVAPRTPTPAST
jgi:peptidyl-dipeptidase A